MLFGGIIAARSRTMATDPNKEKQNIMAFAKGTSGNPAGRKPGIVNQMALRALIAKDLPQILEALKAQALAGDVGAIKLLIDRVLPALRPTDQPVSLDLSGTDLSADGRQIITAVGSGSVTPDESSKLLSGIGSLARVIETTELLQRIELLEQKANDTVAGTS